MLVRRLRQFGLTASSDKRALHCTTLFRQAKLNSAAHPKSINSISLVGVVHDIQTGFVYEDAVTQFTLTTTSIDTTNPLQECVVEKDHHTVRCFGEEFSADVKSRIKEGCVACVSGRLRMNPQLEPSSNKHFYFPYVHVAPPFGQVAIVQGDRRKPPPMEEGPLPVASAVPSAAASAAESAQQ